MERSSNDYIDAPREGVLQLHEQTAREPRRRRTYDIDQEIHIAIRTGVAARDRPEHAHVSRAVFRGDLEDFVLPRAKLV